MQSLDAFLARLLPLVPACPDPLAKVALIDGAIEFCEATHVLQVFSEPQAIIEGTASFDLDIPPQHAVAATLKLWFNTDLLVPAPAAVVRSILAYFDPVGTTSAALGVPGFFYEVSPGTVGIYPLPQEAGTISAKCAVKPLRSATMLADELLEDWADAIVSGACRRLMMVPGQPFSNPELASVHAGLFRREVEKASNLQVRGRVGASVNVTARPFA